MGFHKHCLYVLRFYILWAEWALKVGSFLGEDWLTFNTYCISMGIDDENKYNCSLTNIFNPKNTKWVKESEKSWQFGKSFILVLKLTSNRLITVMLCTFKYWFLVVKHALDTMNISITLNDGADRVRFRLPNVRTAAIR